MCRHLAYLGPPRVPGELLVDAPHSLARQAYAPADMRSGGTVNVDGFGLGWYQSPDSAPLRYRRACPIWADQSLLDLARGLRVPGFLAAVRSGTPGMPVSDAACAPFTADGWLFSHNGTVAGWPDSVAALAGTLPVTELLRFEAPTDSVLLWALLRRRLHDGQNPVHAVSGLVAEVEQAAPGSRLNLLLTDGRQIVGNAWTHALSVRAEGGGVVVASEPYDRAPGWTMVPDGHVVRARPGSVEVMRIGTERAA